jgi:hypothetical protein
LTKEARLQQLAARIAISILDAEILTAGHQTITIKNPSGIDRKNLYDALKDIREHWEENFGKGSEV